MGGGGLLDLGRWGFSGEEGGERGVEGRRDEGGEGGRRVRWWFISVVYASSTGSFI